MSETVRIANDIEWIINDEYSDNILHGVGVNQLFSHIKRIDKLPLKKGEIRFSDDIWDFNGLTLSSVAKRKRTFKFSDIPSTYKDLMKFFVLSQIWEQTCKIQTIHRITSELHQFIKFITDRHIISIEYITLSLIKEFIFLRRNLQPETIEFLKRGIKRLLLFYSTNYKEFNGTEVYQYLDDYDSAKCNAQRESNKRPDIPSDYFDKMLACMVKVMNDISVDIDNRGLAAIIILLSQTGLRHNELINCTIGSMSSTSIHNGTKTAYYMSYMTTKGVHGDSASNEVYTILTLLGQSAYKTLEQLYIESRNRFNSNLLFVPTRVKSVPLHESTMPRMLTKFMLDYGHEIGCVNVADRYPELIAQPLDILIQRGAAQDTISRYKETDILSIPRPHQFRVHLCTQLYEQGVPLLYIQRHMNHLSHDMAAYYIRPKKDLAKEQSYAESVMRMALTGEAELIGDNKDVIMATIKSFVAKSKFNVATDLDEIIKSLARKVPIREKNGGICIKSGPIRDCSKDSLTDEIYCAYGMCPNHFHLYFMVDISYDRYATLLKTVQYNTEQGFTRAAQKEKNKLQWVIQKSLLPEIHELKKELQSKGALEIKKNHPQISWFIDNVDIVYEEISKWIL